MSALGIKEQLALGQPTLLNDTHASGAGTMDFFIPVHTNDESDFSAIFQVVGTLTSLTAALQVSLDGGNTFNDLVASASFLTTSAPVKVVTPVFSGGVIFRVNVTVCTGSQDFYVSVN
jgi:hypothetical protein